MECWKQKNEMPSEQSDSGGGEQEAERELEGTVPSGQEANASGEEAFEAKEGAEDSVTDALDLSDGGKGTAELEEKLLAVTEELKKSTEAQRNLEGKVIQTLKENANFQIQVRQNMQNELEEARKKLGGTVFIPLLKELAELYVEWQDVLDDMEEGKARRKVSGIFEILRDILEENGCEFGTSDVDAKRSPKYSKLKDKVPTGEKGRHETIAKSHNPWIVKEPFVLYAEKVDVYVYDEKLDPALTSGDTEDEPQDELQD